MAAARAIVEDTGYWPGRLEYLATVEHPLGVDIANHHLFLGHGAHDTLDTRGGSGTRSMDRHLAWTRLTDVPSLVASGRLRCSAAVATLLHVLAISGPTAPQRPARAHDRGR